MEFTYKSTHSGKGLVAEVDGFLCFITPEVKGELIFWKWSIQSGGGWTHRGSADKVETHRQDVAFSVKQAEEMISDALEELAS